ncbi:MAG: hypothetical protein OXL41_11030 [Nitrospinae bacterium]|nr:hypothetical protein [Nitrospinota bacterium]
MKTWFTKEFMKASAVLLIVFAAGAGTGYVGGHKYAEYKFHNEFTSRVMKSRIESAETATAMSRARSVRAERARGERSARRRSRGERRFMRRLERDLKLNPAQRTNVDRALERHYQRIRDIRRSMRPQINSIMQEIRRDVRSFLDDEQKISFDKMVQKFEERRKRRWRKFRKQHQGDPAGQSKKQ